MELCSYPIAPLLITEKYLPLLLSPSHPRCLWVNLRLCNSNVSNYLWANSRRGKIVQQRRRAKITSGKYNPVYSIAMSDWSHVGLNKLESTQNKDA